MTQLRRTRRDFSCIVLLWLAFSSPLPADPITEHFPEAAQSGCMACHAGSS